MKRRDLLKLFGILAGSGGATAGLDVATAEGALGARVAGHSPTHTKAAAKADLVLADWVIKENKREGSVGWVVRSAEAAGGLAPYPAPIEGYVDRVSYQRGDELHLFVNTTAKHFRADVYRMGYYQGTGARRVRSTAELPGRTQTVPGPTHALHMIECNWEPSATLLVDDDWLPGAYLIHLVGGNSGRHYVPFTVRDDTSKAAYVVQSSVTTWQAYNLWGGYSLYGGGKSGDLADRARLVSFDRPYRNPDAHGSGDFLGNEFPFVFLAERLGLDVTYWTDVDLHERPALLANHRCLVSLGHDEYWSWQMRYDGVVPAIDKGLNVAFLGANACYRQIRLEASPLGPNRRIICYKNAAEDPITASDPRLATGNTWATDPIPAPESGLIGSMYQSFGGAAPFVVSDDSSWVFSRTGLRNGHKLVGAPGSPVIGSEFDGFEPGLPHPSNLQILGHSPTNSASGELASDMTYYTKTRGGGVFATGTARWVQLLWNGPKELQGRLGFAVSPVVKPITTMTENVLEAFGAGPAGNSRPSEENWQHFYRRSAPVNLGKDVP